MNKILYMLGNGLGAFVGFCMITGLYEWAGFWASVVLLCGISMVFSMRTLAISEGLTKVAREIMEELEEEAAE